MRSEDIIDEIINGIGQLPTLPGVAMKILETVQDQKSGLQELAEILSTDPPLSPEVLRMIKSCLLNKSDAPDDQTIVYITVVAEK